MLCSCYAVILVHYISEIIITTTWCIWLYYDADNLHKKNNRQTLASLSNGIQVFVICGLSLLLSGVLDKLLNTTGDALATGTEILDQNVLNQEFVEIMMSEIEAMRDIFMDRSQTVTYYQLYLTNKQLAESKEPTDKELQELESVNDGD